MDYAPLRSALGPFATPPDEEPDDDHYQDHHHHDGYTYITTACEGTYVVRSKALSHSDPILKSVGNIADAP